MSIKGLSGIAIGGEYTEEERSFLKEIGSYIKQTKSKFPTFTEILTVVKSLGYKKISETTKVKIFTGGLIKLETLEEEVNSWMQEIPMELLSVTPTVINAILILVVVYN